MDFRDGLTLPVAGQAVGGVMHSDLRCAVHKALAIPRAAAREHAQRFSWDAAARMFHGHLVASRGQPRAEGAAA